MSVPDVMQPQTLSLAFRHDTKGARMRYAIARVTGSPVHVALLFDDVCIEADGSTVRSISRAARLEHGEWTVVRVPMSPTQVLSAYRFACAQLKKPYDRVGVLFHWWAGRRAGLSLAKWFCSKLAAAVLQAGGMEMEPKRYAAWTPRALFDWCAIWRADAT